MRGYVLTFALSLISFCFATVLFCLIVDPYNQQTVLAMPSLYPHKYFEDTRTAKAINLTLHTYDALILGSSRTEIAINPQDPSWYGKRVYNAALAGSNMFEMERVFQYALNQQSPKLILLGLDFGLFSENRSTSADFALSRFDEHTPISAFFKENLSKPAIEKALRTLRYNKDDVPPAHRFGQHLAKSSFEEKIQKHGQYTFLFKTLNTKVITNREAYNLGGYSSSRLELLGSLIQSCADQNIQLIAFISPIHALQLSAIHELGLWPEYENWKRDLVQLFADYPGFSLYDFSNWNDLMQEEVPPAGSPHQMQWYWETSHYKQELGHLMLMEMLSSTPLVQPSLATVLTSKNIEQALKQQDGDRLEYQASHPMEVAHIRCLVVNTCSANQPPQLNH